VRSIFGSKTSEHRHRPHRSPTRRLLHKLFGDNRLIRAMFGKNSKLVALQIVLLLLGIAIAYKAIVWLANYQVPIEEKG
jgi:hypothetical protein